jgi:hypothetical protein
VSEEYTLSDILGKWRKEQLVLMRMVKTDYGAQSPEQNQIAYVMLRQITQCITDLDAVINRSPINRMIVKERSVNSDGVGAGNTTGVE